MKGLSPSCLISISILGCGSLPLALLPSPPTDWEMRVINDANGGSCKTMGGVYESTSDAIEFKNGQWKYVGESRGRHYSLFVGPAQALGRSGSKHDSSQLSKVTPASTDWFAFGFSGDKTLVFEFPVPNDLSVVQLRWSLAAQQFECNNGRIEFPIDVVLSGGEGLTANVQRQVKVGLAADGSLLVLDQYSQAKQSLRPYGPPTFRIDRFHRVNVEK